MWRQRLQRWLSAFAPYAGVFTHGMGQTIVFSTLPALGREIGLAEIAVGGIISASSAVFFFGSRMWGRISDQWGRKPVILIGLWGYTAGTLVIACWFAAGMAGWLGGTLLYGLIIGTRMAQSMLMSGTAPGTAAWVADTTTPLTRAAGMGRLSAASNIGSILGPAFGGLLAALSLLAPLVFAALATAAAALLIQRLLHHDPALRGKRERSASLSLLDRRYLPYLALGFAVFTGFSIAQQTLAFRIQDTLLLDTRVTAQTFGFTMMISACASLFAQAVLVQRFALTPMMLLRSGMPVLLCAFVLLIWAASLPAFCIAMALLGFGLGLSGPGFTSAISLAVSPREQGAAAGIATAIPALGFIIGPLLGTGLYQVNPHYPYVLTTLIMLPACVLVFRVRQHLHVEQVGLQPDLG
jgi:MFS family permease